MTIKEIASMIDISAVRAESTWNEIEDILQATRKYPFICIFSMPSMLDQILPYRKEIPNLRIGGIVGFPSGGETLETKLFEARQLKEKGCDEIDMVLNIGKLKSGFLEEVKAEIEQIKAVVSPLPLKVIMEVVLLTDEEYSMDGAIIYRTKKFENLSGSADCEGDADGQLRLITDSNYALTGELQDKETSTCLYSANPNLVRLLKDALANEIRLIEIEKKDASI